MRFYNIAQGSASELRNYILLCISLQYIGPDDTLLSQSIEIAKMLSGLTASLRKNLKSNS
ncbi:MAG: four helix bundle protein [Planctomycetes bacterium]|nr:four helix bundle protein [Planctomycetota bacterium]